MPFIILVSCAVLLTFQEYYGTHREFAKWFPPKAGDQYYQLKSFAWWSGWRVTTYLLLPMLIIKLTRQRLRDYYISLRNFGKHLPIYVVLFLLVLPFVYGASRSPAFYHAYPFYKLANRSAFDFWAWEVLYALQFLSLEFFFRGFLLQGLRRAMGSAAIFVMVVPLLHDPLLRQTLS